MEVILARGSSPVKRETFTNESVDLNSWRNLMKPGDNLVIDIKSVTRRTFEGQDEKVDIKVEIIRFDVKQ